MEIILFVLILPILLYCIINTNLNITRLVRDFQEFHFDLMLIKIIYIFIFIFIVKLLIDCKFKKTSPKINIILGLLFGIIGILLSFFKLPDWLNAIKYYMQIFLFSSACSILLAPIILASIKSKIRYIKTMQFFFSKYWKIWLTIIILGFGIFYFLLGYLTHINFASAALDQGLYDQVIWHFSRLELPQSTIRGYQNIFGDHFQPILLLLSMFYWIHNNISTMLVVQAFIISIGAIPIYLISYKYLKSKLISFVFVFSYLSFFGFQNSVDFCFHPEIFIASFLAYLFYFYDSKKIFLYYVFFFLALTCKESVAVYLMFWGIYIIFWKKDYKNGLTGLIIAICWFYFSTKIIIPHFINNQKYIYFTYSQVGNNLQEMIKNYLHDPFYILKILIQPYIKLTQIFKILTISSFLPLISPHGFLVLPFIIERFLSDRPNLWSGFYYESPIISFLLIVSVLSIKDIIDKKIFDKEKILIFFSANIFLITLAINFYHAPLESLFNGTMFKKNNDYPEIEKNLKKIPDEASVSAQMHIASHLAHRRKIYIYGFGDYKDLFPPEKTDYIVLTNSFFFSDDIANDIEKLKHSEDYEVYKNINETYIFKLKVK